MSRGVKLYISSKIWDFQGGGYVGYLVVARDIVQAGIHLPKLMVSDLRTQ